MRRAEKGVQSNALGRSRGGFSTKLHAVVDTKGRPIYIALTPGQRHEMIVADELLAHSRGKALIADTGYDSNRFRQAVRDKAPRPPKKEAKHLGALGAWRFPSRRRASLLGGFAPPHLHRASGTELA